MGLPFPWMGGAHKCIVLYEHLITDVTGYSPAVSMVVTPERLEWLTI